MSDYVVVWDGKRSLHDLCVSERDQLLFQSRCALVDHAPHESASRYAGNGKAHHKQPAKKHGRPPVLELRTTCADCGGPLIRDRARKGWSRCVACSTAAREAREAQQWALAAKIHPLVREGMTYRRIAEQLELSLQQVARLAQWPEWPTLEARRACWRALRDEGISTAEIAWRYKVSPTLVSRELQKA